MKAIPYTDERGRHRFRFEGTDRECVKLENDGTGFCVACGAEAECCEPDAEAYECAACGEPKVYGMLSLLERGFIKVVDDCASCTGTDAEAEDLPCAECGR